MKLRANYVCQQCASSFPQWYGKCPNCNQWNSLVETISEIGAGMKGSKNKKKLYDIKPQKLSQIQHTQKHRLSTGFNEFDRVMGDGIVSGSVTLLSGDPGIGKSTMLLHVIGKTGGLYISGEESAEQVKLRAKRLGIDGSNIDIFPETNVEVIISTMTQKEGEGGYPLVIIDSIQTLYSDDLEGMAGSVGQVRHCAERITTIAKARGIPVIIIGHVTKDGNIAGPRVLEHMVDTVLYLEGERFATARILRTLKNRFGAIEEVGIFEMVEDGLKEIANPSALFLQDRVIGVAGSVVTVLLEGTRPILVEIQALVVATQLAIPRRVGNGIDFNRLQLLIAVLQKRLNVPLGNFDIFVNVSGGMKIGEPAADLAVALAVTSSFKNKPIEAKTVVFGELGLLGEVRTTVSEDRRIKEATRLGFQAIISPTTVKNIREAVKILT